jgi:NADH-quinone oxidoreductase subunit B
MLQEKIKGESLSSSVHEVIRHEDPERTALPNLPADTIEQIAGPFGNSTNQNRTSGLVSTRALSRPRDRRP